MRKIQPAFAGQRLRFVTHAERAETRRNPGHKALKSGKKHLFVTEITIIPERPAGLRVAVVCNRGGAQ
jgi:hypothetical protein